ncbi:hypothetical protein B9Z51_16200 [Limnohabitans sp. T6-5]|uniref:M23 family metallopeptidase n=1 Tax=Limnohabitans sp. T6-5 TaxID=1100724 RepID=UPI000D33805F|nr:M23 family metallopeptidase [Limnohabitans sp. T6-5]PUE06357.1 hypothetical protein B9Z51_16200 [Limnohabitans sp. T6-5]
MQLIWVSAPTAKVVTLSITARTVMVGVLVVSSLLVALGVLFHFVGLRVAVEYAPELATRMGGVTSQGEQDKVEAAYRAKLEEINQQWGVVTERLQQLESSKSDLLVRLGIERLLTAPADRKAQSHDGRGGPLKLLPLWGGAQAKPLSEQMTLVSQQLQQIEQTVSQTHAQWQKDMDKLDKLPTALPLANDFLLTSSFGVRSDPLTHLPSMHEGIDFVAPVGTPIQATAAGLVLRSERAGAYGNMIEVSHADGFVTRYAHLKTAMVQEGAVVQRGDTVGLLGNTGRSTGPHLHYEVIYKGQAMHPAKALAAWAKH